jgi:hypothetical protein
MQRFVVVGRENGHAPNSQIGGGATDSDGNFPAIRDEDSL